MTHGDEEPGSLFDDEVDPEREDDEPPADDGSEYDDEVSDGPTGFEDLPVDEEADDGVIEDDDLPEGDFEFEEHR